VKIDSVEAIVLRAPIETPVKTSFGTMHDRPAVVVRIRDAEGIVGWGEAWCNFPACGAEHRARLVKTVLAPLLVGREIVDPAAEWRRLTEATRILALQCGEPGPFAQAIAGVDIALWDLAAKHAGQPLWRMLSSDAPAEARPAIRVYASGINPDGAEELVACKLEEGYQAFKLKVGFGPEIDLANLQALRRLIGPRGTLMADANQAWDIDGALKIVPRLRDFDLTWLEEPLAADAPAEDWEALAKATPIPLAAGENLRGTEAFETAISAGILSVIQPDVAKWGGISECISVARRILQAGRVYCPHYLGGGIGLAASAHVLAAVGGPGMLEIDSNDNPLVRGLWPAMPQVSGGQISLPDTPGLGVEPDQAVFRMYQVE